MPPGDVDSAALFQQLGNLAGTVQALKEAALTQHQATMLQLNQIREDMHRMQDNHNKELALMEERLNQDIKSVAGRVATLEQETKDQAVNAAKQGVFIGGASTVLTVGFLELIKQIGKHF